MLDQFKDLFGRFQNLNLINLKIDLEDRRVPMGVWGWNGDLCPMAHGIDCMAKFTGTFDDLHHQREVKWKKQGWPRSEILSFAYWWDGNMYLEGTIEERQNQLTQLINSMWQERMADADAVQEILEQEPLVEELPCSSNVPTLCASR